jgi:hypothetical protein
VGDIADAVAAVAAQAEFDPEHAEELYYGALGRGASWADLSVEERRAVVFFDMDENDYEEQLLEMMSDGDEEMSEMMADAQKMMKMGMDSDSD